MAFKFRSMLFKNNYPIVIKELSAASIAGLALSFTVVVLWLIVSPTIYLVLVLFAILGSGLLLSYLGMQLVLNPPRSLPRRTPADFGIPRWEDIRFRTEDGLEIGAWFIPPSPASDGATMIFVHGMSGNRSELLPQAAIVVRHGYGALLLDLRNHGRSSKALTTFGYREVEDVRGAVKYLIARPTVNSARIGVMGYSMGAATVLRAAARIPYIRAVITQSAFTSLEENIEAGIVAQLGLPPFPFTPLLIWLGERTSGLRVKQVRPIDEVAQINPCAVMFIHGEKDGNVSPDNSRRLYAAAYEPKSLYLVEHADHQTLMSQNPQEYERKMITFLERYLRRNRVTPDNTIIQ